MRIKIAIECYFGALEIPSFLHTRMEEDYLLDPLSSIVGVG